MPSIEFILVSHSRGRSGTSLQSRNMRRGGGRGGGLLFISCMSPDFFLVPDHQIEYGSGVFPV